MVADAASVGEAVRAARAAQADWARTPLAERAARGRALSRLLAERSDEIARVIHDAMGKTLVDAMATEVVPASLAASYYARIAPRVLGPRRVHRSSVFFATKATRLTRVPFGVVAIISPWNYPFGIPFHEVVQALLSGNAVMLKPATQAMAVGEAILRLVRDAGFPEGLLRLVRLPGAAASEALLEAGVDKIFFTGSTDAGRRIAERAAEKLVPVVLELGGSDAMIVLDDASIERAAAGALWAGMSNAGQSCAGVQRVLVEEPVRERFVKEIAAQAARLRSGGAELDTDMGPMANPAQKERVEEAVRQAEARGARVVARVGSTDGLYHPAVVLDGVNGSMAVLNDEVFGPVIAVVPVSGDDEAVSVANASRYGLTASVWSRDRRRAERIAGQLLVGTVMINDHMMSHGMAEVPWGGFRDSGSGRSHGEAGFLEMTRERAVIGELLSRAPRALWWYPYDRALYDGLASAIKLLHGRGLGKRLRAAGSVARMIMRTFRRS